MKKLLVAVIVVVVSLCLAAAAFAEQPVLKLSNLNLGSEPVGSTVEGVITVTNRSADPIPIYDYFITGETPSRSFFYPPDNCRSILEAGASLLPGDSCVLGIRTEVPSGHYVLTFCVNFSAYCRNLKGVGT
jgi:hypothetical protein